MQTATIDAALDAFCTAARPLLAPGIELDGVSVRFDATGWTVRGRARADDGAIAVWVHPPGRDGGYLHAAYTLSYPRDTPHGRYAALHRRLDAGDGDRLADALERLLERVRPDEPPSRPLDDDAARDLGRDGDRIAPFIRGFARCYGVPLRAVSLPGDPLPSIGFPDLGIDQQIFMRAPPALREDVRNLAYLRDLGFSVDAAGRVSTVPLPYSYERRRRRLGLAGGFRPRLMSTPQVLLSPRRWLGQLADGVLPINVSGRFAHAALAPWRTIAMRLHPRLAASWHNHFHTLGHDMSLHVLAMHRIDVATRRALSEYAMAALAADRRELLRVAGFFEEELALACRELWSRVERPEDFDPAFTAWFADHGPN